MRTSHKIASGSVEISVVSEYHNIKPPAVTIIANHGGPGIPHEYMLGISELLGEKARVVFYDQRGCGLSSVPELSKANYTMDNYAEDLDAIINNISPHDKVHLLGHSWGGLIAQYYALQQSKRVASLILIASIPPDSKSLNEGMNNFHARIQQLQEQNLIPKNLSKNRTDALKQIMPVYFYDTKLEPVPKLPDTNGEVSGPTFEALGDFDFSSRLKVLELPVLSIYGDSDPFGKEWGDAIEQSMPSTHTVVLRKCGHFPWTEQPTALKSTLEDWLFQ